MLESALMETKAPDLDSTSWLQALRRTAADSFASTGYPTIRQEEWRYTNLRALEGISFHQPQAGTIDHARLPAAFAADSQAYRLVLVDGMFSAALSNIDSLPPGVMLLSLGEALHSHAALVRQHLGRLRNEALTAMNTANFQDGFFLRLAANVVVDQPIRIIFLNSLNNMQIKAHPRGLVIAEAGSRAVLLEHHLGNPADQTTGQRLSNPVIEISLGEGAQLQHYKVQRESLSTFHLATTAVSLASGAHYDNFILTQGGKLTRNEIHATLNGPGADCRLNGAYMIDGAQHADTTSMIDHAAPDCTSRQVYKGVIDGTARGVFQGKIIVRRDSSQKTDGYQLNRALLLSDAAEIDSKPELEIYADDVKCSHGATVGELDDDALFYLRARGIPLVQARALLTAAFVNEAVEEITNDTARAAFHGLVDQWLAERGTGKEP